MTSGVRARIGLVLACALLAAACGGVGRGGPQLSDLRPPPRNLGSADAGGGLLGGSSFTVRDPLLNWGVGVLRVAGEDGFERIDLALFDAPGGRHWGWATRGRIYDLEQGRPLPDRSGAAVQVPGGRGFLVVDARNDGWLQIRYGQPDDRGGGFAWTRADLAEGRRASFVRWERLLDGARGLVFRNAGAAHNLRAGPGRDAAVIGQLEGENFDLDALDIDGDWMRVQVHRPPACAGTVAEDLLLGGAESSEQTGWIAWRSADRGPWIESAAGPRCEGGA